MNILLLNQCFYPDVVSTGQHLTDLACALAARGHQVTVVAGRRGYDDPTRSFRPQERWRGVHIRRVWSLGLGKTSRWRRALNFASFLLSCALRLLTLPKYDLVVALTSPPLIAVLGALFVRLRGGRLVLWIMDLNPDEAIAAGWLHPHSAVAHLLTRLQLTSFRAASHIVALDRFMAERLTRKGVPAHKLTVIPPWSHDDTVRYDHAGRLSFRAAYGLTDKYVVMYSGNHSPCHPLDTLLEAARRLCAHGSIALCFIGGGSEFDRVRSFAAAHGLTNLVCAPYQPLERLSASLSAADLHVVVMGDAFTGIVHPCKLYNILTVGLPFLYIGPAQSHIADVLARLAPTGRAWAARHGDVDAVVTLILAAARGGATPSGTHCGLAARFSKTVLLPQLIELLESVRARTSPAACSAAAAEARAVDSQLSSSPT